MCAIAPRAFTSPAAAVPLQTTPLLPPLKHLAISPAQPSVVRLQNRIACVSTRANPCLRRRAQFPLATYNPPACSSSPRLHPDRSTSSLLLSTPPSCAPNS